MRADRFRAMGSDAVVLVVGGAPAHLAQARRRVEELEARWSRFRPDSELNRLNAAAGDGPRRVSADTFTLLEHAREAWRLTDGRFDPTVLGDVLRAGYTTSFDDPAVTSAGVGRAWTRGCDRIELDPVARTVALPAGVGVDPGGIGKGLAADLVVAELLAAGAAGAAVNLGGDVRVAGAPPADAWVVAVDHPWRDEPAAVVHLDDGAVATSSRLRRAWTTRRGAAHHLIDPRHGRPATVGAASATAVAARGWQAEALAKAGFLAGPVAGVDLLDRLGVGGLVVDEDGAVLTGRGLRPFLAGAAPAAVPS
ncbi:MAG TPA: FAD:protein FMN transferase [Acidimicrobiia bacterium]|nr:FAD:protein FMN transferase [Acidimicrobiia bacterium]